MLKLGRSLLMALAILAGLVAAIYTAPWLEWRRTGAPMPPGTEARWLFSALLAALALLLRLGLGRIQRARAATELARAGRGEPFVSRASVVLPVFFFGLVALFAFRLWTSPAENRDEIAAGAAVVLGLFAFFGWGRARQILRPGPMLRIDADGIEHARYGPIPWRDVVGMSLQRTKVRYWTEHTLMPGIRDVRRYLDNAPGLFALVHGRKLHGTQDVGTLPLPLNPLDKDPQRIYEVALALRSRHRAPFLHRWDPSMESSEVNAMLKMQALTEDAHRLTPDIEAGLLATGPEEQAAFERRLQAHQARHEALMPEYRQALETRDRRTRRDVCAAKVTLAVMLALLALWVALQLMR